MFALSHKQLVDIAEKMAMDILTGLATDDADIRCIPTFLPLERPPDPGTVLAIDVGGTNARCAVVSLHAGNRFSIDSGPVKRRIPVSRGVPLDRSAFLAVLAGIVQDLNPRRGMPTGYCFSYPAQPGQDGDAVILNWTKELFVNDTIGEKAGQMLRDHLNRLYPGLMGNRITVINDTVAALLAGMAAGNANGHIGLIAGTGTNMALMLPASHIPKLAGRISNSAPLPVNLESGNFHPPHLTPWDDALNNTSRDPSRQRFEKAVSGVYLPYLLQLACPESDIHPENGSAVLFQKAYQNPFPTGNDAASVEAKTARQLIERSASLVAAALAGGIKIIQAATAASSITITAEGGLFHAHPRYKATTQTTLTALLSRMGTPGITPTIQTIADANLKGCAIAGLA